MRDIVLVVNPVKQFYNILANHEIFLVFLNEWFYGSTFFNMAIQYDKVLVVWPPRAEHGRVVRLAWCNDLHIPTQHNTW